MGRWVEPPVQRGRGTLAGTSKGIAVAQSGTEGGPSIRGNPSTTEQRIAKNTDRHKRRGSSGPGKFVLGGTAAEDMSVGWRVLDRHQPAMNMCNECNEGNEGHFAESCLLAEAAVSFPLDIPHIETGIALSVALRLDRCRCCYRRQSWEILSHYHPFRQ